MRVLIVLLGAASLAFVSPVIAKENPAPAKPAAAAAPAKKTAKTTAKTTKAKPKPAAKAAPEPPKDPSETAVASCKKHIESMLKESAETTFGSGPELKVQPVEGGNFDVSGWVSSRKNSGETKRADFMCHAAQYGGSLWTTKTSLSYDH